MITEYIKEIKHQLDYLLLYLDSEAKTGCTIKRLEDCLKYAKSKLKSDSFDVPSNEEIKIEEKIEITSFKRCDCGEVEGKFVFIMSERVIRCEKCVDRLKIQLSKHSEPAKSKDGYMKI